MRFLTSLISTPLKILSIIIVASHINISTAIASPSEQQLMVVFLYNFLKFTEWPPSNTSDNLTLCVTDNTPFTDDLNAIDGKSAQNKTVHVKSIELGDNTTDCQLLFLPREEKLVRIHQWLKNTHNSPILMVSDIDNFRDMGGMIALINDGSRLQFEINLTQVKYVGLKLSAQLLKIARDVQGKEQ